MRSEYHDLKMVGALTIQDSKVYQANMLQQVMTQQDNLHQNLQTHINEQMKASLVAALATYTNDVPEDNVPEPVAPIQEMNNITATDTTEKLFKMIGALSKRVEQFSPSSNPPNEKVHPKTGKPYRRYCWSCGCSDHSGCTWPNKQKRT